MKIMNREEFLKCPKGTVFSHYDMGTFAGLYRLVRLVPMDDFLYSNLICPIVGGSTDDETSEMVDRAAKSGAPVLMDFKQTYRDGCLNGDDMFAVYEEHDVCAMLPLLTGADLFVDNGS